MSSENGASEISTDTDESEREREKKRKRVAKRVVNASLEHVRVHDGLDTKAHSKLVRECFELPCNYGAKECCWECKALGPQHAESEAR